MFFLSSPLEQVEKMWPFTWTQHWILLTEGYLLPSLDEIRPSSSWIYDLCKFFNFSHWRRPWRSLNSLHSKKINIKFGWNSTCGSNREEVEKQKFLQPGHQMPDKMLSDKLFIYSTHFSIYNNYNIQVVSLFLYNLFTQVSSWVRIFHFYLSYEANHEKYDCQHKYNVSISIK